MKSSEQLTVSVNALAKALGISRGLAYEAVKSGEIPAIRIGKRWLIPKAALEAKLSTVVGGPKQPSESVKTPV
ncbi:MAG: helix-turn-helix domain-containing protein [Gammaproteobacteria bacterium]|nr:helix-turn-helix domain-containing protein [Gammaproteobacteria bacterium]